MEEVIKAWGPIAALVGVIFYTGYHFRTLQSLRKHAHEVNEWRNVLPKQLIEEFVTRREFEKESKEVGKKLDEIGNDVKETHRLLVSHLVNQGSFPRERT